MNPWRGLGELPREVWILFTATLVNRAGTMALPFLVLYLTRSLGFSGDRAGLALTAYGIGALITAPVSGRVSDRLGPVRVMRWSLLVSGAILISLPFTHSFTAILAITFVWAATSEAFRPAAGAITADLVAPEQRKAAFALNRLAINLGMSVGPAIGGFLAVWSFPALFFVDGATSILAGVIIAAARWRTGSSQMTPARGADVVPRAASAFFDRRLLYFLAALIPVEMVLFQSDAAMPLFVVRDLRLAESAFGLLFTINTVLIILIEVPLNQAMAGWPHRRAMALGALACGAGFGAMAFASGFLTVAGTVVVWTFGEMILLPASSAYVAEIAPLERRGEYMGLYTMSFSLAFAVGPWLGVSVFERFGAAVVWGGAFVFGCMSAAMMARVHSKPASVSGPD